MLNKEDLKHKEFIKLNKKLDKLQDKLDAMPNIELNEPYQRGWVIKYDVRDDIKSRKDYPVIKEIIERGYCDSYTSNVNVVKAIRKGDTQARIKSRWGQPISISFYYPHRNFLTEKEFLDGGKLYDKYFILDTLSERYRKFGRRDFHVCVPSYWLVLKVKPNMITHKKLKGGAIEKEHQFIYDKIHSGEFSSFFENSSSSYPAYKDRGKVRTKISKYKNGLDDDIFNEKVPKEYHH